MANKVPGTFNGGVPPNVVWDEKDPPIVNMCTQNIGIHAPNCEGDCDKRLATETETELINEYREWTRAGMDVNKLQFNPFRAQSTLNALSAIIVEEFGQERVDKMYQELLLERMRGARLKHGDDSKRAMFGIPPRRLLGPDGKPMH